MDNTYNTPISYGPEAQPRRPQRRMRQAEAAESTAETDDVSSCVEYDTIITSTESTTDSASLMPVLDTNAE